MRLFGYCDMRLISERRKAGEYWRRFELRKFLPYLHDSRYEDWDSEKPVAAQIAVTEMNISDLRKRLRIFEGKRDVGHWSYDALEHKILVRILTEEEKIMEKQKEFAR